MKKTGLFYWPGKGNVETCAKKIYEKFYQESIELHSIDEINDLTLEKFKV